LFGRKSGESVKVQILKIGAAGYGGDKSPGCLASFILTESTRRMTPHLLKSDVPFKVIQTRFSSSQIEHVCPFVCGFVS